VSTFLPSFRVNLPSFRPSYSPTFLSTILPSFHPTILPSYNPPFLLTILPSLQPVLPSPLPGGYRYRCCIAPNRRGDRTHRYR
jgi:hypothetical protein